MARAGSQGCCCRQNWWWRKIYMTMPQCESEHKHTNTVYDADILHAPLESPKQSCSWSNRNGARIIAISLPAIPCPCPCLRSAPHRPRTLTNARKEAKGPSSSPRLHTSRLYRNVITVILDTGLLAKPRLCGTRNIEPCPP